MFKSRSFRYFCRSSFTCPTPRPWPWPTPSTDPSSAFPQDTKKGQTFWRAFLKCFCYVSWQFSFVGFFESCSRRMQSSPSCRRSCQSSQTKLNDKSFILLGASASRKTRASWQLRKHLKHAAVMGLKKECAENLFGGQPP
jgi:hypothetical protein